MPPRSDLDLDQLNYRLRNVAVGHTLDYHVSIASTMPLAHELAASSQTRAGTVVIADEQTAGRGRLDRRWESPPGFSLLCSVILKPPLLPGQSAILPMLTGIAVVAAIEAVVPAASGHIWLKWPNDVLLGRTPETAAKVAGILIESRFDTRRLQSAVLGIGINVNQAATELPPVPPGAPPPGSLRLFAGAPVSRTDLLVALCNELAALLVPPPSAESIYARWRGMLANFGHTVAVTVPGAAEQTPFTGRAVDVTPEGELIVEDAAGVRRTFAAADVSLRAP